MKINQRNEARLSISWGNEELQRPSVSVVVGIDKFKDSSIPQLKFAAKDAKDFARFLVEKGNFAQDQVLVLTNDQATKFDIQDAIFD